MYFLLSNNIHLIRKSNVRWHVLMLNLLHWFNKVYKIIFILNEIVNYNNPSAQTKC